MTVNRNNNRKLKLLQRTALVAALITIPATLVWFQSSEPTVVSVPSVASLPSLSVSKNAKSLRAAIFYDGFESEEIVPPVDYCVDPSVNPGGFQREDKTWTQTFSSPDGNPSASYPSGVAFPTPVGTQVGLYRVVPFTPNSNQTTNLYWDQVQARPQDGYFRARPARTMMFAITPCYLTYGLITLFSGDLRNPVQNHPDPFQRPGCRKFENSASLLWTTDNRAATESNDVVCRLEAGVRYALVIAPVDPSDGIQPGEETCELENAAGCDVGVSLSNSNSMKVVKEWIRKVKLYGEARIGPEISYE